MYLLIYSLVVRLYYLIAVVLGFFNTKAKKWVLGRKDLFSKLQQDITSKQLQNHTFIWFHCASLGEFEQGRPLIEKLKGTYPEKKIILTFFSPSGYEIRKNYTFADIICYLPLDTKANARRFLDIVQPSLVFWVKYEYWFYTLEALHQRQIQTFLVSSIFKENHFFFSHFGQWHRKCLSFFEHIFVQNQASKEYLNKIGIQHVTAAGDTRLDRVLDIANENKRFELLETFKVADSRPIIICGSTWQPDEAIILQYINDHNSALPYRFIVAPHEIKPEKIYRLTQQIKAKTMLYSKANINNIGDNEVLIIDNVGMLSALYKYGKIAYIGGAFGSGLHNILEPIVFGLPVIFGHKYQKFEEATALVDQKGCFSINNYHGFKEVINYLNESEKYESASMTVKSYVDNYKGATDIILQSAAVLRVLE